ncbi:ATP-binding protein [Actinoplanes sp. NPDC026619]|uniref:ATP-binding protein n=1 Tax=Actinoplanes sp. NPDC026619 TaxID=3155798 RepID=UPI003406A44A
MSDWPGALRTLVAAHVEAGRERWRARDRPGTVHDAIDEILTGHAPPVTGAGLVHFRDALRADERWARLVARFAVPITEGEFLALLTACELDPALTRVLGYLDDAAVPAAPTPAVAARLFGWPAGHRPGPASALVRWRLAEPGGGRATSAWEIDGEIVAYLAGDPGWAAFHDSVRRLDVSDLDCLHPDLLAEMATGVAAIGSPCEVQLIGAPGFGRRTLLAQLAGALGRPAVELTGDDPVRAVRTARLSGAIPIAVEPSVPVEDDLVLVARRRPAAESAHRLRLTWTIPAPTASRRHRLWASHTEVSAPRAVREWDLSPGDIRIAAVAAAAGPAAAEDTVRRRLRAGLPVSASALDLPWEWDDLIVPGHVEERLLDLRAQIELSQEVLRDWEFQRLSPGTTGVTALFAGPSGTGKTMSVQVLARSLALDVLRVDLAEVVDKYIGETEKRLEAVFAECERSHLMIFFDEADALFGQRTRVRDAHDRYANIEIDYLLQRLDRFTGVAVLATNRKADLDPAFRRRLRVIVDFAPPGPAERIRLWRRALPARTSAGEPVTGDVDHDWLADRIELTGAEIASVALNAAFDARRHGELIGQAHVLAAARQELAKRGDVLRIAPENRPIPAVAR